MSTHVGDFYVVSSKQSLLDTLHQELNSKYGEVSVKSGDMLAYLGVQISKIDKSGRIKITQPGYVKSLEELLEDRAISIARDRLRPISHSMSLENQTIDKPTQEKQLQLLAKEILDGPRRNLW
jgi:hypothetical protein